MTFELTTPKVMELLFLSRKRVPNIFLIYSVVYNFRQALKIKPFFFFFGGGGGGGGGAGVESPFIVFGGLPVF